MDLDRGVLAKIDRKLYAGLGQNETYRMVRVPVTAAKWTTWKRYCDSAGSSMGRAIATLIDRELAGVFGNHPGDNPPVFAERAEEELAKRQEQVTRRERRRCREPRNVSGRGTSTSAGGRASWRPANGESSSQRRWLLNPYSLTSTTPNRTPRQDPQ